VFKLDLMQPVSIFVAQEFGYSAEGRDICHECATYEYNKILTGSLPDVTAVRVLSGSVTTTSFWSMMEWSEAGLEI